MIYINRYRRLEAKDSFVLIDFDRTLTVSNSTTTWGVFEESPFVDSRYKEESLSIYDYYRPLEIDQTIPFRKKSELMETWIRDIFKLMEKYHIGFETIIRILNSSTGITLRKDAKKFLGRMKDLDIPVLIVSAGVGDIIVGYLTTQDCNFKNISVYSNFFTAKKDGHIELGEPIIHPLSKGTLKYPEISDKKAGLVFGDQIEDIKMGQGLDTINVGFCDTDTHSLKAFRDNFDVVLTGESSFDAVGKVYIKEYK